MRNSERSTFRRCRLKWHWSYNARLTPDREKGALSFGSLVHEALAEYYPPGRERGPHPAGTFAKLYDANTRRFEQWDDEGNAIDARELGIAMMEGYVAEYGKDDHIEIIAPEMALDVDVYDANGNYLATWVGRGDAAFKDLAKSTRTRPWTGFLEHKTAKTIDEAVPVISGYGEQALSYWWGGTIVLRHLGLLADGAHVTGVRFNWLRKALPDTRPRNADGHALNKPSKEALLVACQHLGLALPKRPTVADLSDALRMAGRNPDLYGEPSARQPRPLFHREDLAFSQHELASINRRLRVEAAEMAMVRSGKLPIYKNPTKDCRWDCPFNAACEVHEMGGDYKEILAHEFIKWDPYEGHELLEERS